MAWLVSDARVLASAEVSSDRSTRRRGLLKRDSLDGAFILNPCRWIHTVGMRFPIDVAYVDNDDIVIKITKMHPYRIGMPHRRGHSVIEAEAGAFDRWQMNVGDKVEIRDTEFGHDPEAATQ